MPVGVLLLFLAVPWVGLQCVIVAFSGQTHCFSVSENICDGQIL